MLISGISRSVFISLFAIIFGAVQVLCACMPASASTSSFVVEAVAHEIVNVGLANSILGDNAELGGPEHPEGHHPDGDHDHADDCAHCDTTDSYLLSAEQSPTNSIQATPSKKIAPIAITQNTQTRANLAPTALAGLRWLHPPSPTPVQLKIKLLN